MSECPFCGSWYLMTVYFEDAYEWQCQHCGRRITEEMAEEILANEDKQNRMQDEVPRVKR